LGREAPALNIESIARACGVSRLMTAGLDDTGSRLEKAFREALSRRELTLVIVRC
jgi:hypothetical protein